MLLKRVSLAGMLAGLVLSGASAVGHARPRTHHEPEPSSAPPTSPDMVRPSVGKQLEAAESDARARRFPEAMAQIDLADHARDKTAHETFVIAEMRASVAQPAGDFKAAIAADDVLLHSGKIAAAEQQKLLMAEASSYYQLHDYAGAIGAIQRYTKAGGTNPAMQQLLIQCYYLLKDYAHAAAVQSAQIEAELRAHQVPPEAQLQLLANCQLQTSDQAGLSRTMVRLVTYYPKPDYWAQLLHGFRANPNVPDRLQYDIDRIRLQVGLLTSTSDFMDMTELAVQAGLPMQALDVMNRGYASGALGHDPQAPREARLKALVERTIAAKKASIATDEASARSMKDGNALLAVGYAYVDLGQAQNGIAIMKEAIAKGGLVAPEDAELHFGLAYMQAGDKADVIRTLQGARGTDGAADLAQLWLLRIGKT